MAVNHHVLPIRVEDRMTAGRRSTIEELSVAHICIGGHQLSSAERRRADETRTSILDLDVKLPRCVGDLPFSSVPRACSRGMGALAPVVQWQAGLRVVPL
jgi:hypothetical protein